MIFRCRHSHSCFGRLSSASCSFTSLSSFSLAPSLFIPPSGVASQAYQRMIARLPSRCPLSASLSVLDPPTGLDSACSTHDCRLLTFFSRRCLSQPMGPSFEMSERTNLVFAASTSRAGCSFQFMATFELGNSPPPLLFNASLLKRPPPV